ncbi:MAG: efflux RND transporter periplasmic adaptor subunit [Verrucomicrobiota bacterium]|jgi:membrane fusion protein (multidrug efflux system)
MKRKILAAVFVLLLVVGGLAGVKVLEIRKMIATGLAYAVPPESVSSVVAHVEQWQDTLDAIGSIAAVQGVTVTPEIAGTVSEIAFQSGAVVARGDLLVLLDTSSEAAQLRAIEAQVELARLNALRLRRLRADNTVSQSDLDQAEATLKEDQADADAIRAAIGKKTLRAPFDGRLGIRMVNLGEYLDTGKPVVSLQSLSPVYVNFSMPQQELARLKTGMRVRVTTDTYPDRKFEGTLTAINPDMDASTRSVGLQATLDNTDQLLRPGMFARVEVLLATDQAVLVIPATSVLSAPYGDSVYVIEPETATNHASPRLVVRQQFIRTSRARGDFVGVETGVKAGERVVNSGLFKLHNGMVVVEHNNLAPKAAEAPHPPER